jgi:tetratricopeptide (TPR) repeat protein
MTERIDQGARAEGRGGSGRASERLAAALRERPIGVDQLTRARMERNVLQGSRAQGVTAHRSVRTSRRRPAWLWAASLACSAVAGALFAVHGMPRDPAATAVFVPGRFELRIEDAAVQSGMVMEAQTLESGPRGRIAVELGSAHLDMREQTQLRFERLSRAELAFSLSKGRIDVAFHPEHSGEQRLRIETRSAQVLVVGTRFSVEVDELGSTTVRVTEGTVDVVPRSGAGTRRLGAGAETEVRLDDGDAAVRARLEAELAALPALPVTHADTQTTQAAPELDEAPRVATSWDATLSRLESARQLLRQAQHRAARTLLRKIADEPVAVGSRVEALMLLAESYTAQGDIERAAAAYRHADGLAPRHSAGHNARFALARLLEKYAHDRDAALAAYRRYLALAPDGALSEQARQALCRLGSAGACD